MTKRYLIIGDVMLDRYYYSNTERISPEAPIPIHQVTEIEERLGGAGNVAHNLNQLKRNEILFLTVLGQKKEEDLIKIESLLQKQSIPHKIWKDSTRFTTVKNRIYSNDHLVARFDMESTHDLSESLQEDIYEFVKMEIIQKRVQCILFSDYQKGILTFSLCQKIIQLSKEHQIRVYIDPKVQEADKYKGAFLMKPNRKEADGMIQKWNLQNDHELLSYVNTTHLVITRGKESILYFYQKETKPYEIKTNSLNTMIKDVTGCGDCVFASIVFMYETTLLNEIDSFDKMKRAIQFAHFVGQRAVGNIGTYCVSMDDIFYFDQYQQKTENIYFHFHEDYSQQDLKTWIEKIKKTHSKIVFTNGCFDLIHIGHLQLLHYAKSYGDYLIVAINSDDSIKRLKGPLRPIHSNQERYHYLKELKIADAILLFDDNTPEKLLSIIQPDVLIKGGDYTYEQILGKEYCKEIKIFHFVNGYSSTKIIEKIKNIQS